MSPRDSERAAAGDHLAEFRAEIRAWLLDNCPASMRTPMREDDEVWGGRNAVFGHPDQKI